LGLPIAKQIVEEHGGLIHVVSKPSEGTTFNIVLPMTPHKTDLPSTY
ncbi:HAMP domain-containing histidine kinase, partial [Candidatus Poribacteria bacterium]|nr:HAMP domain-containing histidine kinase [Candidatus Poribacteria bacterium]